jgi:hypothetical protein
LNQCTISLPHIQKGNGCLLVWIRQAITRNKKEATFQKANGENNGKKRNTNPLLLTHTFHKAFLIRHLLENSLIRQIKYLHHIIFTHHLPTKINLSSLLITEKQKYLLARAFLRSRQYGKPCKAR